MRRDGATGALQGATHQDSTQIDVMLLDHHACAHPPGLQVKSRRVQRSKSGGDGGDGGDEDGAAAYDPATQELPAELIRGMLAGKYQEKWARLGLANYAPVRDGCRGVSVWF